MHGVCVWCVNLKKKIGERNCSCVYMFARVVCICVYVQCLSVGMCGVRMCGMYVYVCVCSVFVCICSIFGCIWSVYVWYVDLGSRRACRLHFNRG